MLGGKTLLIRIYSSRGNERDFSFEIDGLRPYIEKVAKACSWNTKPQKASSAGKASKPLSPIERQRNISQFVIETQKQLSPCCIIPAGIGLPESLTVEVYISLNPNGSHRLPTKVLDETFKSGNPAYRALAESALRAVNGPKCVPLKLPPEAYQ